MRQLRHDLTSSAVAAIERRGDAEELMISDESRRGITRRINRMILLS